jgi:hypothetical protein
MELKMQCSELVQSKSINLSLLVSKPQPLKVKEERVGRQNRNPNLPNDKKKTKL